MGNNAILLYDSTSAVYSENSISGVNQVMDLGDNEQYTINPDVQNRFAYYRRSDLAQYEFPTGINRVEDFCFARSSLQKIKMPDTVTSVGYAAFYHCNELKEIELSKNITDIEAKAFEFTPWLQDFYDNSSEEYLIVGDGVLLAYKGNQEEISIPAGGKYIAAEAFNNHYEIK